MRAGAPARRAAGPGQGPGPGWARRGSHCQSGRRAGAWTRAPAIYLSQAGTQGKSAQAMRQYSLLKVLFPFSPNPELYRLS
jgi:hypothetical protein